MLLLLLISDALFDILHRPNQDSFIVHLFYAKHSG